MTTPKKTAVSNRKPNPVAKARAKANAKRAGALAKAEGMVLAKVAKPKRQLKTAAPAIYLAREAMLNGAAKAQKAVERITGGLYEAFNAEMQKAFGKGWSQLTFAGRSLSDKEKHTRDGIAGQRKAVKAGCEKRGISFSACWQNVKKWDIGRASAKKKAAGARANEARPLGQAQREIGSALYSRGMRSEHALENELDFNFDLGVALKKHHKVDLSTLTKS